MAAPPQLGHLAKKPWAQKNETVAHKPKTKKTNSNKAIQHPSKTMEFSRLMATVRRAEENKAAVSGMRSSLARSIFGASLGSGQMVRVRLPLTHLDIVSSAASVVDDVYGIQMTQVAGNADWLTTFATYRIVEADIVYTPFFKGSATNTGQVAAGIMYGSDISVPLSVTYCQQLDQSKFAALCNTYSWHVDIQKGLGNLDWIATGTNLVYATWKAYSLSLSGVGVSTNYGSVSGHCIVEFKGIE